MHGDGDSGFWCSEHCRSSPGGLLALYNQARFGSALESGLRFHRMGGAFVEDYARYGAFSLHHAPRNILYELLSYPLPGSGATLSRVEASSG